MGDTPIDPVSVRPPFYRNEKFLAALVAGLACAFAFIRMDMSAVLIRPVAMTFGKAGAVRVVMKSVGTGKYNRGNFLYVAYDGAPDDAPTYQLKVNDVAYATLPKGVVQTMHYIPGCPSCIALDEDYGSTLQKAIGDFFILGIVLVSILLPIKRGPAGS